MSHAYFKDVSFTGCKFDLTTLMFNNMKNITFTDCMLHDVKFNETTFSGNNSMRACTIEDVDFHQVAIEKLLDMTSSTIISISGLHFLKNARFTSDQLISLAPFMALDLGLDISNDHSEG